MGERHLLRSLKGMPPFELGHGPSVRLPGQCGDSRHLAVARSVVFHWLHGVDEMMGGGIHTPRSSEGFVLLLLSPPLPSLSGPGGDLSNH